VNSIILASSSPRRQELFRQLHIPFDVKVAGVDESVEKDITPGTLVETLALRKARAVAREVEGGLVVGSDTVVALCDRVLGKPVDHKDAFRMLDCLQGREHKVFTGLAVIDAVTGRFVSAHECTVVHFRQAEPGEIEAYVATGEPLDKAGAYGIQGLGAVFVSKIEGCYFNVVGLPVARLVEVLGQFGVSITGFWEKKYE